MTGKIESRRLKIISLGAKAINLHLFYTNILDFPLVSVRV